MVTDRTTKALLLAIALGLWVNLAGDWLAPVALQAQATAQQEAQRNKLLTEIQRELSALQRDLSAIADGQCSNNKICDRLVR